MRFPWIEWTVRLQVLCLVLLVSLPVHADTTGIIAGIVSNQDGEPIVGATVMIEETSFGAITDTNGEYVIVNLDPGTYQISARMIGYSTSVMDGVTVIADQMSRIDFEISMEVVGTTIIRVEESRSHILQDIPATIYLLDLSDLRTRTTGRVVDLITSQSTVVLHGGEMHLRGGRAGEVDYLIDGVSIRSPMDNLLDMELPLSALSNATMMTGGLGVEYGNAMSGIVNLIGKEGGNKLSGSITYRGGDMTTMTIDEGQQFLMEKTDIGQCRRECTGIEISASGPELITSAILPALGIQVPGTVRFNASAQMSFSGRDTLDTRGYWENNWRTDVSGMMKITFRPMTTTSIALSALGSYRERGWNEWAWSRFHLPAYIDSVPYMGRSQDEALPIRFNETRGFTCNLTQLLGSETSLKLTLSSLKFQNWHRIRAEDSGYVGEGSYPSYWLTQFVPEQRIQDSLGFYHTGMHPNVWLDSKALVSTARLDLDYNPNTRFRFKTGLSATYYDLYRYSVYALSYGNTYLSQWDAYPHSGAFYAQGSYRFTGGVNTTVGIRADLFNANASIFSQEAEQIVPVKSKWQISPRVGFSVPFSERSVFFTTYGHYFQMPPMDCLFLETTHNFAEEQIITGNPDLDAECTSAFEIGIRHIIDRYTGLSLAAYYKDITGLVNTEDHEEGLYYVFTNDDSHGMVRGIEITLFRQPGSHLSGQLSYCLSIAKGRYSSMLERYNYAQSGIIYISHEDNYLDWDQTHTVRAGAEIQAFESEGPEIAGIHLLERSSFGLFWSYGSGLPYTLPPQQEELVETNTERYPCKMQTDLTCSRSFDIGPTELNLIINVYNLFNRRNIIQIYDTALFHTTGIPGGEMNNPRAWSPVRHFLLSAVLTW